MRTSRSAVALLAAVPMFFYLTSCSSTTAATRAKAIRASSPVAARVGSAITTSPVRPLFSPSALRVASTSRVVVDTLRPAANAPRPLAPTGLRSVEPTAEAERGWARIEARPGSSSSGGNIFAPQLDPPSSDAEMTISSVLFDDNATANGGYLFIPPDPAVAVGPTQVIVAVNSILAGYDKTTGASLGSGSLDDTFGVSSSTGGFLFDPRVLYDEHDDRFLLSALGYTDTGLPSPDPSDSSHLYLVRTDSSDAEAGACVVSFDTDTVIGGHHYRTDFDGLATDRDTVYITANLFRYFSDASSPGAYGGARLYAIAKSELESCSSVTAHVIDPFSLGGSVMVSLQPAKTAPPGPPAGVGVFLLGYDLLSDGTDEYVEWLRIDSATSGSPTGSSNFVDIGAIEDPNRLSMDEAPQTGGTDAIAVNGWSVLDAIYRRDKIWIAMTVEPSSGANANQATAAWVALNASNPATPTFAEFGTIGGNDLASNASTFMPNLAVGPFGALGMGFAWSAGTTHPSAGFAVRPAGGSFGGSKLLLAGTDYYLRAFGGPSNRWGDYSGAAVDPIDGCFWFYNEASETAGDLLSGEDGRWQTLIGKYCGNIVFLDDFERGDTCRWSSAGCF